MRNFFDIEASVYKRWFLGSPYDQQGREVDPRLFTQGVRVEDIPPLSVPIAQAGEEVDFNLCAFDMPVTPRAFNEQLEKLVGAAIQRIPITVEGDSERFEILNICETAVCLDEQKTKHVMKWTEVDGRPEKVGGYRMIIGLKVDAAKLDDRHIFRIDGWRIALICSDQVKNVMI